MESLGFKGFVWPRYSDGSWWSENDYSVFQGGTWPDFVYESFSWELSFYVPHDVNALIEKCGGKEPFTRRLDTYFLMRNGINGGIWGCSKSRTNRDF